MYQKINSKINVYKLITFMFTEAPRLRSAAAVAVFPRAAARWSGVLPETSIWSTSSPSRVISSHSHPEIPSCNMGVIVSTLLLPATEVCPTALLQN